MTQKRQNRPRATKKLWLDAAIELLIKTGADGVKIMPLAERLGLTRTGFYHHFRDRDALLDAMIERWERKNSGNLVAQCDLYAETICEAMFNLQDCWFQSKLFDAQLDRAIRNWADHDRKLKARVDAADAKRKTAIQGMFERFGYPPTDAEIRTMTILFTQVGYIAMEIKEDHAARVNRVPLYVELFTGKTPTKHEISRFRARNGY
ncbi:TetR/AcrR family transcriptional regulator [Aliiroseovarius sp. F20344]|uniref:TetR/AcrR family transcriptional regulator n=1 Tax=Aliiroseovarius sp. F20344 TaxID=2926414 RepID=UPI001FF5929C|nr:TetR/AcrR family transcriptional regulator [Aliiroseovarius sp. F20344]MCK0142624.1 TetR/AcrR family transcriptional regulator [Aliiroseovarius sp. F20344]